MTAGVVLPVHLSSARVPAELGIQRTMTAPPDRRTEAWVAAWDPDTLVYDTCYDPRRREIIMVAPRLLNLWPVFRRALRLDGHRIGRSLRRRVFSRFEILRLSAPPAARLGLDFGDGLLHDLPIGREEHTRFAGRNVLLTKSKDNEIDWIVDWVQYHAHHHGADAVVLFDNGSTRYRPEAIQAALQALPGRRQIAVISAPFPFGRPGAGRFAVPAQFFQSAVMNIARLRLLGQARAVASLDVDEMVCPPAGETVFDAAAKSRFGAISFRGTWVETRDGRGPAPQRDHLCHRPATPPANIKWCVRPDSRMGRRRWGVHRFAEPWFSFTERRDFSYWHCRATSTSWKQDRTQTDPSGMMDLPALAAAWDAAGLTAP